MKKIYLQCGYEDNCKKKDCLDCKNKEIIKITLTTAEQIVIEDFAICDLSSILKYHAKETVLRQKVMFKLMKKMFKKLKK